MKVNSANYGLSSEFNVGGSKVWGTISATKSSLDIPVSSLTTLVYEYAVKSATILFELVVLSALEIYT